MPAAVRVTFNADAAVSVAEDKATPLLADIATTYSRIVKEMMKTSPASGRTYRRGRRKHNASAPGEPPAPDTGTLMRSVAWQITQSAGGGGSLTARVGSTVKYARHLEYGAAAGVKGKSGRLEAISWVLYPRPAWGPALAALRMKVAGIIAKYKTTNRNRDRARWL